MSAFFSFQYPDRIQLLTDGGIFSEDGILLATADKVYQVPDLPIAITGRGNYQQVASFVRFFLRFAQENGFATFVSADSALEQLRRYVRHLKVSGTPIDAEFLVAAYSETGGPQHFYTCFHDGYGETPSYEMENLGFQIAGGPEIGWADIQHLGAVAGDLSNPDFPQRYGAGILDAMRSKKVHIPGTKQAIFAIGGRCNLTTVTPAGVETRTLCTWPDEIGKPITPAGAAA